MTEENILLGLICVGYLYIFALLCYENFIFPKKWRKSMSEGPLRCRKHRSCIRGSGHPGHCFDGDGFYFTNDD